MKCSGQHLFTPLYLKLSDSMPWPQDEKAFYLLTSNGLFLARNDRFFRSCVPLDDFPGELAVQKPFLKISYPRIPRRLLEQIIGFFDIIGLRGSEAAVLIVWNRNTEAVEVIVPNQVGIVGGSTYGSPYPLSLEYEVPALPPHVQLIGDIHSHVDGPAYASYTDKCDEAHRPGIHLVVGRILDEPPQFHCEVTVDGFRFKVRDLSLVLEGYHLRRTGEVPSEWVEKVAIQPWQSKTSYNTGSGNGFTCKTGVVSFGKSGSGRDCLPAHDSEPVAGPLKPELDNRASSPDADDSDAPPKLPPSPDRPPLS